MIPRDGIKPSAESRVAAIRMRVAMHLEKDLLREIERLVAIAGEPQTPRSYSSFIAMEQFGEQIIREFLVHRIAERPHDLFITEARRGSGSPTYRDVRIPRYGFMTYCVVTQCRRADRLGLGFTHRHHIGEQLCN